MPSLIHEKADNAASSWIASGMSLTLDLLEAKWLKSIPERQMFRRVETRAAADGVIFLCPECFISNGRTTKGTHAIICWDPTVPQTMAPRPGRWSMIGNDLSDLSLVGSSSSILLTSGCRAHFFVRNGRIE
jgi:hypothetical protein